jgi:catechol 2,3-dioxygenase-like lactoylglutathione lyase family enzyme
MSTQLPLRLHHHGWMVNDQEANRHYYEDVMGLPLIATWTEIAALRRRGWGMLTCLPLTEGSATCLEPGGRVAQGVSGALDVLRDQARRVHLVAGNHGIEDLAVLQGDIAVGVWGH